MKQTKLATIALMLAASPACALTDVTGMTVDEYASIAMYYATHPGPLRVPHDAARAEPKDCAKIRAHNAKAASMADRKMLPCHCMPMSERADKVYSPEEPSPAGFSCGNHTFYDKQCHQGVTCFKDEPDRDSTE